MAEKTKALESESESAGEPWLWDPEFGPRSGYLLPRINEAAGNLATQRAARDTDTGAKAASPIVPVSRPPPRVPDKDVALARGIAATGLGSPAALIDLLAEREAADVVIELKGMEEFKPSRRVAYFIMKSGAGGVRFPAQFSTIAAGNVIIRWAGGAFQADKYWLPMSHPDFKPRDSSQSVGLIVEFKDSKPSGWIKVIAGAPRGKVVTDGGERTGNDPALWTVMFGRSYHGPDSVKPSAWENALDRGELKLQTTMWLYPPDGPPMWGLFSLYNEDVHFGATSDITGPGVASTMVTSIGREPKGTIYWRNPISLDREWQGRGIAGKVQFSFVDGSFDARGRLDVKYPSSSPRLTGTINVAATTPERAWNIARSNNPAPEILPSLEPQTHSSGIALVGWGVLNLRVTKGLNASAAFIVDPEGHITARGVLRAPHVMDLFPSQEWSVGIVDTSWPIYEFPVHWAVKGAVTAGVTVKAGATLSASLRDLVVTGLYSTRPGTGSLLEISASLNASLAAWLKASAWLEGAVKVGLALPQYCITDDWCTPDLSIDVISVRVGLAGTGSLKAYADVRPKITRYGAKTPEEEAKYKLGGHLEIGGQFEVKLEPELSLRASLLGGPRFGFGGGSYAIEGGAMSFDFEHIIGDDSPEPKFKRSKGAFDSRKFVSNLRAGDAPGARPRPGKYVDPATKKATPTKDTPTKEHAAPPPTGMEELDVPFKMARTPHHLYLTVKAKPSLEMASPTRELVSDKLRRALRQVEATQGQQQLDRDRIELLTQQHADLMTLLDAATTLEDEAARLGQDPTNLMASELPGLQHLASELAEYGTRYQDPQLTGVTAMSTEPIAQAVVQPVSPGASATGIGRIGSHGSKPPSLRLGPEIWWLESEHVIPFATGKRLWEVVNLVVPKRAGHEDRGQTTIMIYEKAARFKTPADNEVSDMFRDAVRRIRAPQRMNDARINIESGHKDAARKEVEEVVGLMVYNLEIARDHAVERTNTAIVAENQMYMEGSTQTNGQRRGNEPPIPYPDQVDNAAARQFNNIIQLAADEIEAANILR